LFRDVKTRIYRHLKYVLTRPNPPAAPFSFDSPVVVVGSAPVSHRPVGFDEGYTTISVNGSQTAMASWGVSAPDITFMQFNQIRGVNTNAVEVRRVLNGKTTGTLYVFLWREGRQALEEGLKAFNYGYGNLELVDRYSRMALLGRVCGFQSLEMAADDKCSNGINAVLFALYHKAPAVIITGINPKSSGHVYNAANLRRFHQDMDLRVLQSLVARNHPVYTADPDVSATTGIPLWTPDR
jgi:hypothetical protein